MTARGPLPVVTVEVSKEHEVVLARQRARRLAEAAGLGGPEATRLATAVSEIARSAYTDLAPAERAALVAAGANAVLSKDAPSRAAALQQVRDALARAVSSR